MKGERKIGNESTTSGILSPHEIQDLEKKNKLLAQFILQKQQNIKRLKAAIAINEEKKAKLDAELRRRFAKDAMKGAEKVKEELDKNMEELEKTLKGLEEEEEEEMKKNKQKREEVKDDAAPAEKTRI